MGVFDSDFECMARPELESLQLKRLHNVCANMYNNVPFYRKKFDKLGIKPEDIKSLADVKQLPFTEKQDLRDNYPFDFLAVAKEDIIRLHASSGTTNIATVSAYTQNDIDNWANCMARALAAYGLSKKDVIQIAVNYGLFTGGLGFHYGAEKLGAMVVPVSGGSSKRQVHLLQDLGVTALHCTPSYGLYLAEVAREEGVNFKNLPLRVGIFGGEPWTEEMRRQLEEKLDIKAYNIYGLSEIMGPGVAFECMANDEALMHIQEDYFYPEIINPKTGEPLPDGEEGELVLTTLTKEGMPLLRYRTRDITTIVNTPCRCGRTFRRIKRIKGRLDDMLIIRGVNVYPQAIEEIILGVDGTTPYYKIIVSRDNTLDSVEILIEKPDYALNEADDIIQRRVYKIQSRIKDFIGITTKVTFLEPKTLERTVGKAKRVSDLR